jgi:hypothetical protein
MPPAIEFPTNLSLTPAPNGKKMLQMGKKIAYGTPARGTVQLSNKPATPNAITAHTSRTSLHAKSFICAPLSPCTQNSFSALPFHCTRFPFTVLHAKKIDKDFIPTVCAFGNAHARSPIVHP